jgi:hypothetical protein
MKTIDDSIILFILNQVAIYWIRHKCNDDVYLLWTAIFAEVSLKSTNRSTHRLEPIHANIIYV